MADNHAVPKGFDELYSAYIDRVYSYARTRLRPEEAEDVASEVFTSALIAMQDGKGKSITEAWLISVARYKVIDRWRAAERKNVKQHLLATRQVLGPETTPEPIDRVDTALDALSVKHRSVLALHYLDGHPMTEVAELLGLTFEGARSTIARARRSFRTAYTGVAIDG